MYQSREKWFYALSGETAGSIIKPKLIIQPVNNFPMRRISLLFLFCGCLTIAHTASEVRVGGSDYLEAGVSGFQESILFGMEFELDLQMSGTRPARFDLEQGLLDVGLLFQDTDEAPFFEGYERLPLGYQIVTVVVNADNPIDSIRINRLAGIFGQTEEFDFNQWGDLGLSEWVNRPILPYVLSIQAGLSSEYFRLRILGNPRFKMNVREADSMNQALDVVRNEETTIALTGYLGANREGLKIVALTSDILETPTRPNVDTVHFGNYPLKVPLDLYYRVDRTDVLRPFLEYLLSDAFAESLVGSGILPLPKNFRERTLLELRLQD